MAAGPSASARGAARAAAGNRSSARTSPMNGPVRMDHSVMVSWLGMTLNGSKVTASPDLLVATIL